MVPATTRRVAEHTSRDVNGQIEEETHHRVQRLANRPSAIDRRLHELDSEWNIERALEANAATLALAGVVLGVASNRKWLALPAVVATFLLQHAVQGWCPPVPVFRRLGFRTPREIEVERNALKALRQDYYGVSNTQQGRPDRASKALAAARS